MTPQLGQFCEKTDMSSALALMPTREPGSNDTPSFRIVRAESDERTAQTPCGDGSSSEPEADLWPWIRLPDGRLELRNESV